MIVTAWNNGAHHDSGAGYGLKVDRSDRDTYFLRVWGVAVIELPNAALVEVNIDKDSFWNDKCRELISMEIGRWLRQTGLPPWPDQKPPKLLLEPAGGNRFRLRTSSLQ